MKPKKQGPTDEMIRRAGEKLKKEIESPQFKKVLRGTISELLPESKNDEYTLIQARVPKELADDVRSIISGTGISWNVLVTACLRRYRIEVKGKE